MRLIQTIKTAATSYLGIISTMAVVLLTVRLATTSLSREEFGLWSFTMQSVGYFLLLDFGVANSLGRLFGEPLTSGDERSANSWFTLSVLVLSLQGAVILAVGLLLRNFVLDWFAIPVMLRSQAANLWTAFLVIQAVSLIFRVNAAILYAQNRYYWMNVVTIAGAWVGLGAFYVMLRHGAGVIAYAWSSGTGFLAVGIAGSLAVACGPNRLRFSLAGIHWKQVRELFSFSSSIFVIAIAIQVYYASQGLVITKLHGLATGAIYAVTSRMPMMLMQVVWKPFDAFAPRWQVAHCAGDSDRVRREFQTMMRFTILLCFSAFIGVVLVNPSFIRWWTKPEYFGGEILTVLLALFLVTQVFNHCYATPFMLMKRMRGYTYAVCANVGVSLLLMILLCKHFGVIGVPAGLLLGDLIFGLSFFIPSSARLLSIRTWAIESADFLIVLPCAALALALSAYLNSVKFLTLFASFLISVIAAMALSAPLAWRAWSLAQKIRVKRSSEQSVCTADFLASCPENTE